MKTQCFSNKISHSKESKRSLKSKINKTSIVFSKLVLFKGSKISFVQSPMHFIFIYLFIIPESVSVNVSFSTVLILLATAEEAILLSTFKIMFRFSFLWNTSN